MPGPAPVIDFRPPWCTDNDPRKTVEVWYDELVGRFECDHASIRELYGLAHLSQRGYEEANDIFWKMCKKVCDDEHIDNPSAFLHRGVKTAREKMQGKQHILLRVIELLISEYRASLMVSRSSSQSIGTIIRSSW